MDRTQVDRMHAFSPAQHGMVHQKTGSNIKEVNLILFDEMLVSRGLKLQSSLHFVLIRCGLVSSPHMQETHFKVSQMVPLKSLFWVWVAM